MIDSTALLSLMTVQDQASFTLLKDLENIFSKQTPKLLQKMAKGVEAEDSVTITRAAHTLKTSCNYLGLVEMVEICRQIEANASRGPSAHFTITMLIQKLENAYFEGVAELNNLIAQVGEKLSLTGQAQSPVGDTGFSERI